MVVPLMPDSPLRASLLSRFGAALRRAAPASRIRWSASSGQSDTIVDALQRHDAAFLEAATLRSWGRIDPGNAKLRELVGELIDDGLWRLLWMPPTLPYWPLEGPFEGKEHATKRLLFSAWNVVPDVVSAVLSYEAERLMMGGRLDSYDNPDAQQRPLLRLTQTAAGVRSGGGSLAPGDAGVTLMTQRLLDTRRRGGRRRVSRSRHSLRRSLDDHSCRVDRLPTVSLRRGLSSFIVPRATDPNGMIRSGSTPRPIDR